MPPGKKGKKSRPSSAATSAASAKWAGLPPSDAEYLQKLETAVEAMKSRLAEEESQRAYFQLERDRLNTFWELTRQQNEELKAMLRNREREMEELSEKNSVEAKIYKQKIRHLLYENKLAMDQLKLESEAALKLKEDSHRESQRENKSDRRESRRTLKETELGQESVMRRMRQEHDQRVTELREEFERRAREMQLKYERLLNELRDQMNEERRREVVEIEQRKNAHIHELMEQHEKDFREIKEYYNDITSNNIELIKGLKEELENMKKDEATNEKDLFDTIQENKKLREPLARTLKEVEELRLAKANYEKEKIALRDAKARLRLVEAQLRDVRWECEVLQQRFAAVQKERDELYARFEEAMMSAEQQTGFRNLLLERKLATLDDTLQKRNVQLTEVLQAANVDPDAMGANPHRLDDLLRSKSQRIQELQEQLSYVTAKHNETIRTYEEHLARQGVPLEDLGFRPLIAKTVASSTQPAGIDADMAAQQSAAAVAALNRPTMLMHAHA